MSVEEPNAPLHVTDEKKASPLVCASLLPVHAKPPVVGRGLKVAMMLLAEKQKYPGFEMLTEAAGSVCRMKPAATNAMRSMLCIVGSSIGPRPF